MRPLPRGCGPARAGTTLLELLLAITVAALVAAVAFSVYITVASSQRRAFGAGERRGEAADCLRRVRAELACAAVRPDEARAFMLAQEPLPGSTNQFAAAAWFVATRPAGAESWQELDARPVRYRVGRAEGAAGAVTLWREVPDAGGGAAELEPLFRDVSGFELWVRTEAGWTNQWESAAGQALPPAARARLAWREGGREVSAETWTLIPVGCAQRPLAGVPGKGGARPSDAGAGRH